MKQLVLTIGIVPQGAVLASREGQPYDYAQDLQDLLEAWRTETGTPVQSASVLRIDTQGGTARLLFPQWITGLTQEHLLFPMQHTEITTYDLEEVEVYPPDDIVGGWVYSAIPLSALAPGNIVRVGGEWCTFVSYENGVCTVRMSGGLYTFPDDPSDTFLVTQKNLMHLTMSRETYEDLLWVLKDLGEAWDFFIGGDRPSALTRLRVAIEACDQTVL